MLTIRYAKSEDAEVIHQLAHRIYYPTYQNILGKDQMDFMLGKSYTVEALQESMNSDQDFYLVLHDDVPVGFIAIKEKNDAILRIEKLYLLPDMQGMKIGTEMINFVRIQGLSRNKTILELNVNRGNKASEFYKKVGFSIVKEVDIPYFGYILDDYIMQMDI